MSSNINASGIDAEFPVPGRDNSTQGFRDNFSLIKNSLLAAKTEIEALQASAITTTSDSNFNGHSFINANLKGYTEEVFSASNTSGAVSVKFTDGHYQSFVISADTVLTLTDWPESGYAKITVALYGTGQTTPASVQFAMPNAYTLLKAANWPSSISVSSSTAPLIFDFERPITGTVLGSYRGKFES